MPEVDIHIVRRDAERAVWELTPDMPIVHEQEVVLYVAIIEGGMSSGAPSIAIRHVIAEGDIADAFTRSPKGGDLTFIGETSLAALAAIVIAARGAFPEAFAGGPLEVAP